MAVIASRPELPASFHSSSYSPSASPRVRPVSDLSQRERHSSNASAHASPAQQQTYRQSWASDSSTTRPRSLSSGNVTLGKERDRESFIVDDISSRDQEQLDRPSFPRTNSGSSSLSARRPLEPSLAANMSSREIPRRQASPNTAMAGASGTMRPASDRESDERYDERAKVEDEWDGGHGQQHQQYAHQQSQNQQQQQSHMPQQFGYFPPPNQPWAAAPQRSGSPSTGPSPGSTPMYFPAYSPQAQLPPQIQQLSPSAQMAYMQAMAQHHYQNNQAGIAAWASAYHQGMMMASQQQHSNGQYSGQLQQGPSMPRSISTQSSVSAIGDSDSAQTQQYQRDQARSVSGNSTTSAAAGYHPYRRQPSKTNVAGKERKRETSSQGSGSARDSTVNYPEADDEVLREQAPAPPRNEGVRLRASFDDAQRARIRRGSSASSEHVPTAKIVAPSRKLVQQAVMESSQAGRGHPQDSRGPQGGAHQERDAQPFDATPPRRNMHKRQSSSTSSVGEVIKPTLMNAPTGSSMDGSTSLNAAQHEGLNPAAKEWKPSPLAQTNNAPVDTSRQAVRSVSDGPKKEVEKKEKTGLRGKIQKAMKRDNEPVKITPKSAIKQATPVITTSVSAPATLHQANDSVGSTSTTTRSTTPPITPPQPATPAGLGNRRPSNSSFAPSLIEPLDGRGGKPKRSLFNMRNASTDNISISSTVSSASMMIRKMGALGKIARRNSLASISKIFKDKSTEDGDIVAEPTEDGKKKKDKKFRFGSKSQPVPTVSSSANAHAVDQDRTLNGLSPAAQLARQHTLKSKPDDKSRPEQGSPAVSVRANRDPYDSEDGSEDDADDVTARMEDIQVGDESRASHDMSREWDENGSHWGQGYVDMHAIPAKGILKSISSYDGVSDLSAPNAPWNRARSNSTDVTGQPSEPGPLAHVTDQGHIDGHRPSDVMDPFSPSFDPFETGHDKHQHQDRPVLYSNVSLNSSAPMLTLANQTGRAARAVTSPMPRKRLNWAPECAIYHTFHATEYDRRSEPATCNRLTPALAQEIKDELNGFKMEEMAVHPSSRIHTHFFV